jgi:hypothetical protein
VIGWQHWTVRFGLLLALASFLSTTGRIVTYRCKTRVCPVGPRCNKLSFLLNTKYTVLRISKKNAYFKTYKLTIFCSKRSYIFFAIAISSYRIFFWETGISCI